MGDMYERQITDVINKWAQGEVTEDAMFHRLSQVHAFWRKEKKVMGATIEIGIKKILERAELPQYATDGSACFDLHGYLEEYQLQDCNGTPRDYMPVRSGEAITVRTGLQFEIPAGYVMLIFSRSGHGFKHGVALSNCVGVIDSDYRGEVKVQLLKRTNNSEDVLDIRDGDRIAQAVIVPYPKISFIEKNELSSTKRGSNGFGSTGQ